MVYTMKEPLKFSIIVVVSLVIVMLLFSSTLSYVFAANPSSGFKSSANCSFSKTTYNLKTCCWRESNGSSLGESYCQSCTMGGSDLGTIVTCGQPELQFRSGQHWGIGVISPSDDKGVLAKTENSNQAEEDINQVDSEDNINIEEQPQEEEQTARKENSNVVGRWGIR